MKKEEVQNLFDKFGFSATVNRGLGIENPKNTHMMLTHRAKNKLVDYYIDETLGSVQRIYAFNDTIMDVVEDISALENWLND